jgi:hypothetical protein
MKNATLYGAYIVPLWSIPVSYFLDGYITVTVLALLMLLLCITHVFGLWMLVYKQPMLLNLMLLLDSLAVYFYLVQYLPEYTQGVAALVVVIALAYASLGTLLAAMMD